ncbi:hypothetical protein [Microbacterium sp. NPDC089696]|uniref:hypothetical protein n=1 Tax=Microbacterium sp. NPDC089696 TaxID=3364199 RepID=UPI00381280FB
MAGNQEIPCDVVGCTASAVVVLAFRGTPGHTHVCRPHELIDREYGDVVASGPLPCPGCAMGALPMYVATPPTL